MNTKDILYHLRTEKGLSQDELAAKIFVTRQAVGKRAKPRRMSKRSSCFPRSLTCRSIRFSALRGS